MPLFITVSISRVHMEIMKAITWFVFVRGMSKYHMSVFVSMSLCYGETRFISHDILEGLV